MMSDGNLEQFLLGAADAARTANRAASELSRAADRAAPIRMAVVDSVDGSGVATVTTTEGVQLLAVPWGGTPEAGAKVLLILQPDGLPVAFLGAGGGGSGEGWTTVRSFDFQTLIFGS